jgi:hypothetical protein
LEKISISLFKIGGLECTTFAHQLRKKFFLYLPFNLSVGTLLVFFSNGTIFIFFLRKRQKQSIAAKNMLSPERSHQEINLMTPKLKKLRSTPAAVENIEEAPDPSNPFLQINRYNLAQQEAGEDYCELQFDETMSWIPDRSLSFVETPNSSKREFKFMTSIKKNRPANDLSSTEKYDNYTVCSKKKGRDDSFSDYYRKCDLLTASQDRRTCLTECDEDRLARDRNQSSERWELRTSDDISGVMIII